MLCHIRSSHLHFLNINSSIWILRFSCRNGCKNCYKLMLLCIRTHIIDFCELWVCPFQKSCFYLFSKGNYSSNQFCRHCLDNRMFCFLTVYHIHNGNAKDFRHGPTKFSRREQFSLQVDSNVFQFPSEIEIRQRQINSYIKIGIEERTEKNQSLRESLSFKCIWNSCCEISKKQSRD